MLYFRILDSSNAEKMYEEFLEEYPEHLPLHTAFLQVLDPLDVRRAFPFLTNKPSTITKDSQNKIITICDKAMDNINEDGILAFSAMKADLRPEATKIKTLVEQLRAWLNKPHP